MGEANAFGELVLGISFLISFNPISTNAVTLVAMPVSIISVLQSILNKRKIKSACLGSLFSFPVSSKTIIEDVLMLGMSGVS